MLFAAIVEDEDQYADMLALYLERYGKEKGIIFRTERFRDAVALLTNYQPRFDLIFMDIEMPHLTGYDAAQHLRQTDPEVPLVFVTSHAQYAPKGYEVSAAGFLIKPVSYYSFYTLMDKILRASGRDRERELLVRTRDGVKVLPYAEIMYIEISGHALKYVTERETVEATGSFSALEAVLPGDRFARCGNSFIVHLKFVTGVTGNTVQIAGRELPISRSRKREFMFRLMSYFGDRM